MQKEIEAKVESFLLQDELQVAAPYSYNIIILRCKGRLAGYSQLKRPMMHLYLAIYHYWVTAV